jgi:hypothetical protein
MEWALTLTGDVQAAADRGEPDAGVINSRRYISTFLACVGETIRQ